MSQPWTEKFRPKSRSELVGNKVAINGLYLFIKNWSPKGKKAALLLGPPGCGKTTAVSAIARELGYDVVEVNASDTRKKKSIQEVLGNAATSYGFGNEGLTKRLILMDEVDGLSGQKDRGGLAEFLKIIKKSAFPIICTANNSESDHVDKIKKVARLFEFQRLEELDVFMLLETISEKMNLTISDDALEQIAENASGDLRAAINDLESFASGSGGFHLSKRNKMAALSDLLNSLFSSKSYSDAKKAMSNAPSNYSLLLATLFDETIKQCKTTQEIADTYEYIALADLTYSRIMKTQDWKLLKYFFDYIGPGIVLSKGKSSVKIKNLSKYPSSFRIRGIGKRSNQLSGELAEYIAPKLHISKNRFKFKEFLLFKKIILGNNGAQVAASLDITDGHIDKLSKLDKGSKLKAEIGDARSYVAQQRMAQSKVKSDVFEVSSFFTKEIEDSVKISIRKKSKPRRSDNKKALLKEKIKPVTDKLENIETEDKSEEEDEKKSKHRQSSLDDFF